MNRILSAFDRLSAREKVLVSVMVGLALLIVVGGSLWWVGSSASELETRIDEDQTTLRRIYAAAGPYQKVVGRTKAMRVRAEANDDLNLKLAINEQAKSIRFDSRDRQGNVEGSKRLSDVIQFDQTQDTYLSRKKTQRKKDKDNRSGYYRRDQPVTLSDDVPFDAIYQLLERLEETDELLFVTEFEVTRGFQDGRIAKRNASIIVSTYYYEGSAAP